MISVAVLIALPGCHKNPTFEARRAEIRLHLQQGYLDAALPAAERAYKESENDPLWHWRFRVLKAETLVRRAAYQDALALLQPEPPKDYPPDIVIRRKSLQGLSYCLSNSDYAAGETALKEASLLAGSDRALLAEATLAMGRCAWQEHDLKRAEDEFRQAEDLAQNVAPFIQASAAGNLGIMLQANEHYDQAIDKYREAMSLAESMQSPVLKEKSLGNLGFCYSELGDSPKALTFTQQTLTMAKALNNPQDQEMAFINLGNDYSSIWDLEQAETNYLQALPIARELHDANNEVLALHDLVIVELQKKNIGQAEAYWKAAVAALPPAKGPLFSPGQTVMENLPALRRFQLSLDEAEIAMARRHFSQAEQTLRQILSKFKTNAALSSVTENDLATALWRENKPREAERMFLRAIHTAEIEFSRLNRDEHRLSFLDRYTFYDNYLQFLVEHHRSVDALVIAERNRAQAVLQRAHESEKEAQFSLPAVQRALRKSRQIALAYSVTNEHTYLWVIAPEKQELFVLPGHTDLYSKVSRFNNEIQERTGIDASSEAQALYGALIQPAEKSIPPGSSVIIVPSRVTSLVNFEALVVPGPKRHYWLEDVKVQYAGSLRSITDPEKTSADQSSRVLIVGNPVEVNKDFPVLKHASEEISGIRSHFQQSTTITGAQAVPAAYRASDPANYRYIHFDTHGINSDLSPLDSAIVLSAGPDKEYKLYAREIKDIPIHADLVTISACYGAGTRVYNAEGTIGLGWAFLRAGARQVIAATWEIDDALTAKFMDDFYGELSQGKSAVDALHDAKLHMLHSSSYERHPYYWASLQLYAGY